MICVVTKHNAGEDAKQFRSDGGGGGGSGSEMSTTHPHMCALINS